MSFGEESSSSSGEEEEESSSEEDNRAKDGDYKAPRVRRFKTEPKPTSPKLSWHWPDRNPPPGPTVRPVNFHRPTPAKYIKQCSKRPGVPHPYNTEQPECLKTPSSNMSTPVQHDSSETLNRERPELDQAPSSTVTGLDVAQSPHSQHADSSHANISPPTNKSPFSFSFIPDEVLDFIQFSSDPDTPMLTGAGLLPDLNNSPTAEVQASTITSESHTSSPPPTHSQVLLVEGKEVEKSEEQAEATKQRAISDLELNVGNAEGTDHINSPNPLTWTSITFGCRTEDIANSTWIANTTPSSLLTPVPPSAFSSPVGALTSTSPPQAPIPFDNSCGINALAVVPNPEKSSTTTTSVIRPPSPMSLLSTCPLTPSLPSLPGSSSDSNTAIIGVSLNGSSSTSLQIPQDFAGALRRSTAGTDSTLENMNVALGTSTESLRNVGNPLFSSSIKAFQITLTTFFSNLSRTKVRRIALLLRALLHDLQVNSAQSMNDKPKSMTSRCYQSGALFSYNFPGDEPLTIEEQLDILAKCSELLSAYSKVYGAENFDERIKEFDDRLRWELVNLGAMDVRTTESAVQVEPRPRVLVDQEVTATGFQSGFSDGKKRMMGRECTEYVIQDPVDMGRDSCPIQDPSSSDVTMLDVSSVSLPPCGSVCPETMKSETVSTAPDVKPLSSIRVMTSMMRDMADLLDCTNERNDSKGKQRAVNNAEFPKSISSYDLPTLDALFAELKSMKEELQRSQQRYQEETDSMARFCRAEVDFVKEELRAMKLHYQRESELIRKRHHQETESLMDILRETEKGGAQIAAEKDKLPLYELFELRRRLTALEGHARSFAQPGSMAGSLAEDELDSPTTQNIASHPLAHLLEFGDWSAPPSNLAIRSSDIVSASKSGMPSRSDNYISNAMIIDGIPLPIKSQRKFQAIHRFP